MDGMNDVLALQSLSPVDEEAPAGGLDTPGNALSHASALVCDGASHLSVLACD